ncbi:MAG: L,D-transpeptidase [Anaerolineae bacterium]|nr:L,D-transpeptidase [Anaerolineae bacterium]
MPHSRARAMLATSLAVLLTTLARTAPTHGAPAYLAAPPAVAQGHPGCVGITYETPRTPACDAVMAAQPYPDVTPVPYDLGVIAGQDFIYFDANKVPLYDAPDGEEVEIFTAGRSSYVNVIQTLGDWAEIRPGRWASLEHANFAEPSTLTGVLIHRMEMPFAWAITDHCTSRTPGGPRNCRQSGSFSRYDLMNIYATVPVGEWEWHLVGPEQWTVQTNLSIVHPTPPAVYNWRWIGVSTYEQNLVAYEGERPVMAALVSTGDMDEEKWRTDPGVWKVELFWEVGPMEGAAGSEDFYALDQVPYHMYFNWREALHGVYWHDNFGYYWSHGCVNLTVSDAKWLWDNWVRMNTRVYVYDEKPG